MRGAHGLLTSVIRSFASILHGIRINRCKVLCNSLEGRNMPVCFRLQQPRPLHGILQIPSTEQRAAFPCAPPDTALQESFLSYPSLGESHTRTKVHQPPSCLPAPTDGSANEAIHQKRGWDHWDLCILDLALCRRFFCYHNRSE